MLAVSAPGASGDAGVEVQPKVPAGWVDQPALAARAADAAAAVGLTVTVQAWGDAATGAFAIIARGDASGEMRTQDVVDGLGAQAAAAGIELREPGIDGRRIDTGFARGRWQGRALVTAGTGDQGRGVELAACFSTDRRPERAQAECAAFLAAFAAVEAAP